MQFFLSHSKKYVFSQRYKIELFVTPGHKYPLCKKGLMALFAVQTRKYVVRTNTKSYNFVFLDDFSCPFIVVDQTVGNSSVGTVCFVNLFLGDSHHLLVPTY